MPDLFLRNLISKLTLLSHDRTRLSSESVETVYVHTHI
jgi:DNA polymerase III delta subunit